VRRDDAASPNHQILFVRIAEMPLPDDQVDDVGRRIDAEYLGEVGGDVEADLDRRLVERAVGIDVVALDRDRRVSDARIDDLFGVVGVGVIIAEVGAELEEEQLDRIAELATGLKVFERHQP
jgi:hypothetical protein